MKLDLLALSHLGNTQFDLGLADASIISCSEIVRIVVGRRIVCRGMWNQQPVYAKLFIGRDARRYVQRDLRGVQLLTEAGILTPKLLYSGSLADNAGEILIFAAIPDSLNAELVWEQAEAAERFALAKSVVREVAHHHRAGLIQADLYLKNFLLQGQKENRRVYTLDGDAIRKTSPIFGSCQELQNLALLLSKFDVIDEAAWLLELLNLYAEERGCKSAIDSCKMRRRIARHRHEVVGAYADKKVFRQCTDVAVEKSWRSFIALVRNERGAKLRPSLDQPDALLDEVHYKRLKNGNTCTVSLAEVGGRKIVVKRYNIKNVLHALGRMFRPSRAAVSWSNAHRLQMHGIATAAPLAIMEQRFGPLRFEAYFLADYVPAPDIGVWMQDAAVNLQHKELVAAKLARLMYKLRLLQIAHGDLKATNIHVVETEPVLIDLDSLHEYRWKKFFEYRHVRDLRRLLRNWHNQPEILALVAGMLRQTYGNDPLLKRAGI